MYSTISVAPSQVPERDFLFFWSALAHSPASLKQPFTNGDLPLSIKVYSLGNGGLGQFQVPGQALASPGVWFLRAYGSWLPKEPLSGAQASFCEMSRRLKNSRRILGLLVFTWL